VNLGLDYAGSGGYGLIGALNPLECGLLRIADICCQALLPFLDK